MFERFTERARYATTLARDEAVALGHNYVGTEHLLLGLFEEGEGLGARALISLGYTADGVREYIRSMVPPVEGAALGDTIPWTPRAKKALELALREALALGHNYIGTEHVLLGLVREDEGIAARILLEGHPDAGKEIRAEIVRMLMGPGRTPPASTPAAPLSEGMRAAMRRRLGDPEEGSGVSSVKITVNAKGARQWEVKAYHDDVAVAAELAITTERSLAEKYGLPGG